MKQKPKILFLIPRLGITDRGAEIVVYELAIRLVKDYQIQILSRKTSKRSIILDNLKKKGVQIKQIHCLKEDNLKILSKISFLKKIHLDPIELEMLSFSILCLPFLLTSKYQIIMPNNGVWGTILCRLVRSIKKIPFVYISHGGKEPLILKQKPNIYVALNKDIAKWIKENSSIQKVIYIPNGVNNNFFKPIGPKFKVDLNKPIILSVGALIPVKKHDLVIKAVSLIKDASLLIVGDGYLKNSLTKLGTDHFGRNRFRIIKSDYISMPKIYRSANLFTLAAQNEPASLVFLEALSSNLPVVANYEDNLKYTIKDAGFLVNTTNIDSYFKVLKKALSTDFGAKPRLQALNFSWDQIVKQYDLIFQELI